MSEFHFNNYITMINNSSDYFIKISIIDVQEYHPEFLARSLKSRVVTNGFFVARYVFGLGDVFGAKY